MIFWILYWLVGFMVWPYVIQLYFLKKDIPVDNNVIKKMTIRNPPLWILAALLWPAVLFVVYTGY